MKVAITGSNGFIGSALVRELNNAGHEVLRIARSPMEDEHILWDPQNGTIDGTSLDLARVDGVVHLAGEGVAEKKWSKSQKQKILESRVKGTTLLATTLAHLQNKPSVFVSGSAIGYYGSRGDEKLVEDSSPGEGFLSEVCQQWEAATSPARNAGIATATIRTGHVLDKSGGMLKKLLPPFKLGLGGRLGDGEEYMSCISLEDHIRAILFILEGKREGAFNMGGPEPVTNSEFTKALGERLSRPNIFPTPLLPLRMIYGSELVDQVLLPSQRVLPARLLESGFTFHHPSVEDILNAVI